MKPAFLVLAAACLLCVPAALPAAGHPVPGEPSPAFGAPGRPTFQEVPLSSNLRGADGAGEPTIGIPWTTDHVFFQAFERTYRCAFTDANTTTSVECADVTPAFSVINLDPMLIADPVSGRIFAGGLDGPCSVMGLSDDDGQTWMPSRNMCSGHQFDHQSVGMGPWSKTAPETPGRDLVSDRATYYCSQGALVSGILLGPDVTGPGAACATSLDGGFTWQPWTEVLGGCGSFHGHIKVSEVTGFAAVPFARCGPKAGFAYSADNGLTWMTRTIPDSTLGPETGFDPAVAFSYQSGWMWYALANDIGMHVGLSKDHGVTWETLGNGTGLNATKWLDLSPLYTDPVTGNTLHFTTFTNVAAGDDQRAAITFLGTTDEGDKPFTDCDDKAAGLVWHYFIAQTFDAGATWTVQRMSDDPVQVGGIWDGGGGAACRNLLDFDDMDIDSHGRVTVGFADGCTGRCASKYAAYASGNGTKPEPGDSRTQHGTFLRQVTGLGLFAKDDAQVQPEPGGNGTTTETAPRKGSPGLEVPGVALVVAALVALRRRPA